MSVELESESSCAEIEAALADLDLAESDLIAARFVDWREKHARFKAKEAASWRAVEKARNERRAREAAETRRLKDRDRKRAERKAIRDARPVPTIDPDRARVILSEVPARERELKEALARPSLTQAMIQLRGRETDYAGWWGALRLCAAKYGRDPSLSELAQAHTEMGTGTFTKQMARRGLERVRALVATGIWPESEGGR
ncbi:MAG: hypothetical protein K0S56_1599 [Microvirga sp.]|jgi:hypothetical protein|nr:hypothetical protein [Microvirga sp.]